jgi:hypothetical protein
MLKIYDINKLLPHKEINNQRLDDVKLKSVKISTCL